MIGRTLGGRYIVESRVGGGGMATVYRGTDAFLRRQVALKILRAQFAGDTDFVNRFRREARAAASLSHPNIVAVFDVGQDGDECHYIVQEFVEGRTLKDRIRDEGALPVEEALRMTEQVLRALGQAHAMGVIHRDVKPQNVLLTGDGRVKVTDFGIAQAESTTTAHSGAIVGTAHYAAPEQVRGRATDERCDLYSTGVMLFEMLTGQVPYDGDGPLAVALKHVEEPVPDPARLRPELRPEVSAVVRHAMQKSPGERYGSTLEFMADVEALLTGNAPVYAPLEPVPAAGADAGAEGEATPARQPRRRWRGGRLVRGAVITLLVAAAAGGAAFEGHRVLHRLLTVPLVAVPNVVGKDLTTAEAAVGRVGLEPQVDLEYNSKPLGTIVQQSPSPGTSLPKGRQVTLWQSEGPQEVPVPDVTALTPAEAESELTSLGLKSQLAVTPSFSGLVPQGQVVSSSPAANADVSPGTLVTLTLSAGPQSSGALPDYVGEPQTQVVQDLTTRQLAQGPVVQRKSGWPTGIVVATNPQAGSPVLPGALIGLTVSAGCVYSENKTFVAGTTPTAYVPGAAPRGILSQFLGLGGHVPNASSGAAGPTQSATAPGSSTSATSSSTSGSSTTASGGLLQEDVLMAGQSGPPRILFSKQVPAGTSFTVQLCWSSPQGATWTWQENGATRSSGVVGTGRAGAGSTEGTSGTTTGGTSSSGTTTSGQNTSGTTTSGTKAGTATGAAN